MPDKSGSKARLTPLYQPMGTPRTTPIITEMTKPTEKFVRLNRMCSQIEPLAKSSKPLAIILLNGGKSKGMDVSLSKRQIARSLLHSPLKTEFRNVVI